MSSVRIGSAFSGVETISLDNLSDVTIISPSNQDILSYSSSLGKWINASFASAGLDTRYLQISNNLSDLNNVATARTNLGLVSGGTGDIWVEKAGDTMTGPLVINGGSNAIQGIVKAFSSQTVNLSEWQKSDGTVWTSISKSGELSVTPASTATSTDIAANISRSYSNTSGIAAASQFSGTFNPTVAGASGLVGITLTSTKVGTTNIGSVSGYVQGARFQAGNSGTGTMYRLIGGTFIATSSNNAGTVTYADAGQFQVNVGTSATMTNAYATRISTPTNNGTITNNYGLYIEDYNNGTNNYAVVTNAGNIVFNEGGDASTDLRIEGDTDVNLLFTDASADKIGIGNNAPSEKLHVTGNILATGYVYEAGTFAEIHVHDASAAESIPTGTTYTKTTAFTDNGPSSNCTPDATNDKITFTKTGFYKVNGSFSFSCGTNNVTFFGAAFLGGTEQDNIHWERKIGTAGDRGNASFTGIIDVTSANTDLDVRVRHDNAGSINFTLYYGNLNVEYLGET